MVLLVASDLESLTARTYRSPVSLVTLCLVPARHSANLKICRSVSRVVSRSGYERKVVSLPPSSSLVLEIR